jgi:hypothetical protein
VLAACVAVVKEWLPWDAPWLEGARLSDPNSWLVGAVTPTVRDPVARTRSGHRLLPLGDAYASFDPLGAQGANTGNRLARELAAALRARGTTPVDDAWVRATYDAFHARWAGPSMAWTQLLLSPMGPAARYLFLAQRGADGATVGGTPEQRVADAFVETFDDAARHLPAFAGLGAMRSSVRDWRGGSGDAAAVGGLVAVLGRQLANAVA